MTGLLKIPSLRKLLSYRNPEVIAKFRKNTGLSQKESEQIFLDMLRFLWLTAKAQQLKKAGKRKVPEQISMLQGMLIIDEMWHTFVLYTPEYQEFSFKYFGWFMHHIPEPVLRHNEKSGKNSDKNKVSEAVLTQAEVLEIYMEFVWDHLGESVLNRWFDKYPAKYPEQKIRVLQVQALKAA